MLEVALVVLALAAPRSPAGPLRGPMYIVPGQRVRFHLGGSRPTGGIRLCYQAGSGRKTCYRTASSWYVVIRPSAVQYFTVRNHGDVVGRLIYVNGRLRTKI